MRDRDVRLLQLGQRPLDELVAGTPRLSNNQIGSGILFITTRTIKQLNYSRGPFIG